jgi:hypothetical protein
MNNPDPLHNQQCLDHPQPGDYWTERVFFPYFLVVRVDGDKITVLDAVDRIIHRDDWEFDYSKHKIVDRAWMNAKVSYSSGGFAADCRRSETFNGIIEEWKQFHRDRIAKELVEFA